VRRPHHRADHDGGADGVGTVSPRRGSKVAAGGFLAVWAEDSPEGASSVGWGR
jgi:hypothetical protein